MVEKIVKRAVVIATAKGQRTIVSDTIEQALDGQLKLGQQTSDREWCKTRLRDRLKALTSGFRWSLAAKRVLYDAFEHYIQLLCHRIACTQRLAGRRTISEEHVIAAVKTR
jgi:histone H3/H4